MTVALAARRVQRPNRLVDLPEPWVQMHRGAGGDIAKDNALSSIDLAIGIMPRTNRIGDADIAITSDGVLVCMHDDTVDRTTNGTGDISTLTLAQVRALVLKNFPYYLGTNSTELVPTFDEYLDKIQANDLIGTPEIKDNSTSIGAAVTAKIIARGMRERLTLGSFWPNSLKAARAAGIKTYVPLSGNNIATLPDAATFLTCLDGFPPTYCAFNSTSASVTDAYLSGLIAGGVKLASYTFNRRTELAAVKARVQGLGGTLSWYTSDNPFYTQGLVALTTDRFATQIWEHGLIGSDLSSTGPRVVNGKLALNASGAQATLMGGFTMPTVPTSIQARITLDVTDPTTTRWAGIAFGATTDASVHEQGSSSNLEGACYGAFVRINGELRIYRRDNPTTSTFIESGGVGVSTPALTAGGTYTLKVEFLTGGTIKATRIDTGHSVTTVVDTTYRGPYWHFLRNGTTMRASIDQVLVTP